MNNPSIAAAAFSAAEAVASQPNLFDADLIPLDLEIGRAAARLAHTGAITTRNEAKAMAIVACKLAGLSDKATAAKVGCSRNTIGPVMEQEERAGRIPALQARLAYSLGRVAESSALELHRIIDDGCWTIENSSAVRALGVAMGIATEKLQLVTGQATAILEQRVGPAGPDARAEWEGKLRRAFAIDIEPAAGTSNSPSEVSSSNPLITEGSPAFATVSATVSLPQDPLLVLEPALTRGGDSATAPPATRATLSSE